MLLYVQFSESDIILQHLQFLAPHGWVRPDRPPSAKFLSFTTRFRILGPVFLTNWNKLGDFSLRVGAAGLLVFACAGVIRDTDRLGLADLELLVVISGAERWCLGVLLRASLWAKLISDVSDSEKLLVLESEGVNFFTVNSIINMILTTFEKNRE